MLNEDPTYNVDWASLTESRKVVWCMWLYRKMLMSDWSLLRNATSIQMDSFYIRYKVFGITVSKTKISADRSFGGVR